MDGKELLELIETGEWKGMPQYKCTLCPFDRVNDKDAVLAHIVQVHLPPEPQRGPEGQPILLDRAGKPLLYAPPGVEVVIEDAAEQEGEAPYPDDEVGS